MSEATCGERNPAGWGEALMPAPKLPPHPDAASRSEAPPDLPTRGRYGTRGEEFAGAEPHTPALPLGESTRSLGERGEGVPAG